MAGMSRSLVGSTVLGFARALSRAMLSEETARRRGLLQSLDPRVRVLGVLALVLAVTLAHRIEAVAALLIVAVVLAIASRVNVKTLAFRVWMVVLGFTGVIAMPALFSIAGTPLLKVGPMTVTEPGLRTAALLVLRVEAAVTLTTVLVLCTPWAQVLKALRSLRLPKEVIVMLAMTYRYVFLLIETAMQMFDSRRSRTVGRLAPAEQRRMVARTAGVLLSKSVETSNEVYLAMQSRGFRGDLQVLSDHSLTMWDCLGLTLFFLIATIVVWRGR
jgi:cobalt ECF transporter T component CbiQ